MPITSLEINDDLDHRLDKVAKDLKQKKDWLIHEAVKQFVERMEMKHRIDSDTKEALDAVARGEYCDGEEVLAWMDSWFSHREKPMPKTKG